MKTHKIPTFAFFYLPLLDYSHSLQIQSGESGWK